MTADELGAEQEEHLVYGMLREQGGIDPGMLGPVIDLAALGLVNAAWRNPCVEDWHAGGRMHDGDMMRVNSHMTWRARQILRRWTAENGLAAGGRCRPLTVSRLRTSSGWRSGVPVAGEPAPETGHRHHAGRARR
jgi:hypothetical protein